MAANLESEFKRIEIVKLDERNFENLNFFLEEISPFDIPILDFW